MDAWLSYGVSILVGHCADFNLNDNCSTHFDNYFYKGGRAPREQASDYVQHKFNEYERMRGLTRGQTVISEDLDRSTDAA